MGDAIKAVILKIATQPVAKTAGCMKIETRYMEIASECLEIRFTAAFSQNTRPFPGK
jgi:hypothetical protein